MKNIVMENLIWDLYTGPFVPIRKVASNDGDIKFDSDIVKLSQFVKMAMPAEALLRILSQVKNHSIEHNGIHRTQIFTAYGCDYSIICDEVGEEGEPIITTEIQFDFEWLVEVRMQYLYPAKAMNPEEQKP